MQIPRCDVADLPPGPKPSAAPRVVLIERDARVRALATFFLDKAGYAVTSITDSTAAFELLHASPPAVVIAEILLPGVDGLALCRQLKAHAATCAIKVLILSILSAQARATEAGADGFLRKPITEAKLVGAVATLVAPLTDPGA